MRANEILIEMPFVSDLKRAAAASDTYPVMGYGRIPRSLAEEAYEAYAKEYPGSAQSQTLDDMAKRGGFSVSEMDHYVPGWRKRAAAEKN